MKNYLLGGLLILGAFSPLFVMGADGWSEGHLISSNGTIAKVGCTSVLDSATCDYTGPSIVLRAGDDYEYSFGDTFWAGSQDRRLKNFCARFQEPASFGDYNGGANPTFSRTSEIANNGYRVYKNTSMNVIKSNSIYQVKNHPNVRSSDNLFIKYVIEYANDEAATTRYHHTECFPYEISRCGDGVVDKDWFKKSASDPAEECDYNDTSRTGWKDGSGKTCNQSCKLVDITPVCNSTYNEKTQYTSSSAQWLKSTDNLCSEGSVTEFTYSGTPRTYTWKCKNGTTSKSCSATQTRCGDGVKNGSEACDEGSKNGTSSSTCSATCTTVSSVSCGTNNGGSKYFASKQTTPWLTKTSAGMCAAGLTVGTPSIVGTDSHLEWTCSNANGASTTCKAYQQYCGDGVKNGSEACDEGSKNGTSSSTCSATCTTVSSVSCGTNNGGSKYFASKQTTPWLTKTSAGMCAAGLTVGTPSIVGTDSHLEWTCSNANGASTTCKAYQQYCGDGVKNGSEACDEGSKNGTSSSTCSATCTTVSSVSCGTNNGGSKYFASKQTTPWLTKTSAGMCAAGLTVGTPSIVGTDSHLEWTCSNANGASTTCKAYQQYCGDGVKNGSEACDEGSKNGTSSSTCSATCTTVSSVSCGTNNGGSKYFASKQTTPWLTKTSAGMCAAGLTVGTPSIVGTDSHLEWTCSNANGASTTCKAYQQYCGDGVKNGSEACDEGSKNGTSSSTCSATCTTVSSVSCGTNNGGSKYFASKQTTPWLTKTSAGMCAAGLTVGTPSIVGTDSHLEWTCSNANGASTTCKAYQQYCGDGVKNGSEECDGTDGCDSLCNIITHSDECDQTFSGRLRLGDNKPFTDTFNAGWHDRYLFDYDVYFEENYGDHNNGKNPTFSWTSQLVNNGKKVSANDSVVAIESTPYNIVSVPTRRAQNNVYIEYTIWYDNVAHSTTPSKSNLYSHKECASYEISRCGDGILDAEYNEECDPGSEGTKVMPDGRICNSECKLVTVPTPVCNSDYNGQRVSNLVNGSYLCREGEVGGFDYDESTHKWTWTCSNVAGSVDCRAIKPYCGDGILDSGEKCDPADETHTNWGNDGCSLTCEPKYLAGQPDIEKTLQDKVPVEKVEQVLKWTVKVTAKGGDVTDFQIQDKLPEALDYVSYKVVSNNDNLTVTGPTGPVKSGSNNIYTWNVKGTLKENHVLTLEVETKVNKMPKSEDDYLNIACVIDDGKIDCDDDEPPVKNGQPDIEKTLQDKVPVEKVEQVLKWTVKVTAKGGDVTDFQIQDKLPEALDYVSYKVVSNNDNLTVTGPTGPVKSGSNNIYTWNVKGTLKENHVLTLEVETKVNKMPKSEDDYLNIACVIDDGKIDCDDDEPPVKNGQPDIEKTLQDKVPVEKVEQVLKWTVKVTAKGGDVTDFQIQDKLPEALDYVSYKVVSNNDNLTVTGPTGPVKSGSNNIYTWNVKGTLKENHVLTLEVETKVNKMPKSEDDYLNIACVIDDGKIDCDDDEPPVVSGKLNIVKTIVGSKEIKNTGDIVTWNIRVTAESENVTNFTITDKMPSILGYSGSFVLHNPGLTIGTPVVSGNEVSWKVAGTLEKGEYVEIQLTTYAKVMPDQDYDNVACVKYVGEDGKEIEDCDDEPLPAPHIWIKKHFTDGTKEKTVKIGDLIGYRIDFGNTGNASATVTSIKDFLPKNVGYISSEIFVNGEKIHTNETQKGDMDLFKGFKVVDGVYIDIYGGITLTPNSTGYIILTGRVLGEYTGNRTNFACIYLNDKKVDCDDAIHTIDTSEVMCKSDINEQKSNEVCYGNSWTVPVKCNSDGGTAEIIEIFCDGKSVKSGHNTSEETANCVFTTDGEHSVKCEVNGSTKSVNNCEGTYKLSHKSCSSGGGGRPDPVPDSFCDKEINKNNPICLLANPYCFNMNDGNISIEKGEYLPFYLNIRRDENSPYTYSFNPKEKDGKCEPGTVDLSSMKCRYEIKSPESGGNNVVLTDEGYCLSDTMPNTEGLIGRWLARQDENYEIKLTDNLGHAFYPNIFKIKSDKIKNDVYGEYKLYIAVTEYKQCNADGVWKVEGTTESMCQNNFVLTAPYTVQKTPSGNLTASTEILGKFREVDGDKINFAGYLDGIGSSTYSKNTAVETAMDNFIKKYEKLAVKVKEENGKILKKVPGKNIYFAKGDIDPSRITQLDKPITIVQTDGNTIIKGDVQYNMMLLTKGNITFQGNCTSEQTVKGIFYAGGSLSRTGVLKNDHLDRNVWCDKGGLYVKGVLIGDNFKDLMEGSRSHIENRRGRGGVKTTDQKGEIMKGGSVVIEYSPSVFTKSTMPPGAEDFTTALSIYKQ